MLLCLAGPTLKDIQDEEERARRSEARQQQQSQQQQPEQPSNGFSLRYMTSVFRFVFFPSAPCCPAAFLAYAEVHNT